MVVELRQDCGWVRRFIGGGDEFVGESDRLCGKTARGAGKLQGVWENCKVCEKTTNLASNSCG
jgi:hypothetical protein